jgi:hypothetical protein
VEAAPLNNWWDWQYYLSAMNTIIRSKEGKEVQWLLNSNVICFHHCIDGYIIDLRAM